MRSAYSAIGDSPNFSTSADDLEVTLAPYDTIRLEHDDPISWIVLDRPGKGNALSRALQAELSDALETLKREGGRVIIIRGEGKGFSAGYDLDEVAKPKDQFDPVADRDRLQGLVDRWIALWHHPKPIICAVHGYCIAGATQLCTFADITIVADDARIGEPTLPIGGGFIAPLWAPLVGPKRAKELAFIPGNSVDGRTAAEWGWANRSVPAEELLPTVVELARRIALTPPDVLRIKKLSINRSMEAMGILHAAAAVPEMDALLHLSPEVIALKEWISEVGIKAAVDHFLQRGAAS